MASFKLADNDLVIEGLYSSAPTPRRVPLGTIERIEVVERSSFYHPVLGSLFGAVCLGAAVLFIAMGLARHSLLVTMFTPRGGLVWVPLFAGLCTFWYLLKNKKIPWLVLHSSLIKTTIPLDMPLAEAKIILSRIKM